MLAILIVTIMVIAIGYDCYVYYYHGYYGKNY